MGVVLDPPEGRVLVVLARARRHGQEARRLVHDEDVLVLVEDGEGAADPREGLAVGVEDDGRALLDLEARLAHRVAPDAHLALLDHVARLAARHPRVVPDEQQVEAHRGEA
jgi:hypothetical protein